MPSFENSRDKISLDVNKLHTLDQGLLTALSIPCWSSHIKEKNPSKEKILDISLPINGGKGNMT